jgi:hypothetical protein
MPQLPSHTYIFKRPVDLITSEDLKELYSVEEGWYVEFKEFAPDNAKLAKSIASFANTYGGLLVVGAKEKGKQRSLESLPGFSLEEAAKIENSIREAVRYHISPTPHFDCRKVQTLNLITGDLTDSWVVLVNTPMGTIRPYIHSSGVIYRRIGDSSSPVAETNPLIVKHLTSESYKITKKINDRVIYLCDQANDKVPRCDVIVKINYQKKSSAEKRLSFTKFKEIAAQDKSPEGRSLFDNFYPLNNSYVARRTEGLISNQGVKWEYDFVHGLHRLLIPLSSIIWDGTKLINPSTQSMPELNILAGRLSNTCKGELIIIDLMPLYYFLAYMLWNLLEANTLEGSTEPLRVNGRLVNVQGCVPFLGTPNYLEEIKNNGVPFTLRDGEFVRDAENISDWLVLDDKFKETHDMRCSLDGAKVLLGVLAESVGITTYASIGLVEEKDNFDGSGLNSLIKKIMCENFNFSTKINPKA